jgi:hypothetical protein
MKWCAIMHTVMCFVWGVYGMVAGAEVASEAGSRAGEVGAAIGTGIGMMMIAFVWFGGVVGCLLLGVILKKPVEESAAAAV